MILQRVFVETKVPLPLGNQKDIYNSQVLTKGSYDFTLIIYLHFTIIGGIFTSDVFFGFKIFSATIYPAQKW